MRRVTRLAIIFILLFFCVKPGWLFSQEKVISWEQAREYLGQTVTVEGIIVRTHNSGRACFLNFHPDYQQYLSLVIFASDFPKFPAQPERYYLDKKVRVRGRVVLYQGRPELILNSPAQIRVIDGREEQDQQKTASGLEQGQREISGADRRTVKEVSWEEAANYYGQKVWVRGTVVAANNTGKVCFLNFHRNWRRYFTVVIFASSFQRFSEPPEKLYLNREIRVYGLVREYQGKPEIIVESPEQIEIIH